MSVPTTASTHGAPPPAAPPSGPGKADRGERVRRAFATRAPLLLVLPALLLLGAVFFFPVFEIVRRSFTELATPSDGALGNYRWFFDQPSNITILRRTFVSALIVSGICLLLAYPYAYLMTVAGRKVRILMLAVVLLPFWSSLLIRNFAWVVLLGQNGPVNNALDAIGIGRVRFVGATLGVTISMVQVLLPFAVLPLYAVLQGIDRRLLQAAHSLGAPPWKGFVGVYLPLSAPGVLAGALIVFVISLGFYITPALLGSSQNALISQIIVIQVQTLQWGRAGAMAVVLLLSTLVLVAVAARLSRLSRVYAGSGGDAA